MPEENQNNELTEQKNNKFLKVLIAVLILFLIMALIYFYFYKDGGLKEKAQIFETEKQIEFNNQPAAGNTVAKAEIKNKLGDGDVDELELKQMAAAFAERFGSFSNQSNYGNISDLKIFMTDKMRNWSDEFVAAEKAKKSDISIYFGVTTKALAEEMKKFDKENGEAEALVKTQRREASGFTSNISSYYQDIAISFKKEKGVWKVDSAKWVVNK